MQCTSVGFGAKAAQSPLTDAELALLPAGAKVFDIVYQPSPTALLAKAAARGLETLDGAGMNLEQAVLGYARAADEPAGRAATRAAMEAAKKALDAR